MTRIELLRSLIACPIWELHPDWFYVKWQNQLMWLHICKPHYWALLEEALDSIYDKLAFSPISLEKCQKCLTSTPKELIPLGKLLALGKEIT